MNEKIRDAVISLHNVSFTYEELVKICSKF